MNLARPPLRPPLWFARWDAALGMAPRGAGPDSLED